MDGGLCPVGRDGSAAAASEPPPAARIVRCTVGDGVVSERPLAGGRSLGLVLIALGVGVACVPFFAAPAFREAPLPGLLLAVALALVGFGYHAAGPATLRLDPAARAYRWRRNAWPFTRTGAGTADEIERLAVREYDPEQNVVTLYLHWRDRERRPVPLHTGTRGEARHYGRQIAALFGLRFAETPLPGPPAPGEAAPCAATLTRRDAGGIVSEKPLASTRLLGLLLLAPGLAWCAAALLALAGGGSGEQRGVVAALFGLLVGLPLVAAGWAALGPHALHVDPATGAYREARGARPFRSVTSGVVAEDFDRLSVRTHFDFGPQTTLRLHRRDPARRGEPPIPLHTGRRADAVARGREVAALLGLPLVDEFGDPLA